MARARQVRSLGGRPKFWVLFYGQSATFRWVWASKAPEIRRTSELGAFKRDPMKKTLKLKNWTPPQDPLMTTAVGLAATAVAATDYRLRVLSLTLSGPDDGGCTWELPSVPLTGARTSEQNQTLRRHLTVRLAGAIAEAKFAQDDRPGSDESDVKACLEAASLSTEYLTDEELVASCWQEAKGLLDRPEVWGPVLCLAELLEHRRSLTERQVASFLGFFTRPRGT